MATERIIYRSRAVTRPQRQPDLGHILSTSVRRNVGQGITGALALDDGFFVQVLEGRAGRLNRLLATLADDPRHCDIRILGRWPISRRLFSGWPMAFAASTGPLSDPGVRSHDDRGLELVGILFGLANRSPLSS